MKKIVLFCYDDYANYMYSHYLSYKAAGVEVRCIKIKKHAFSYANEAEIVNNNQAFEILREADQIHYYHSNPAWWKLINGIIDSNKQLFVYHTGTIYRSACKEMDNLFSNATMTLTDQCEFMMIGYNFQNWKYVATAIDTDIYNPEHDKVSVPPYKIGHYPSNSKVKGSEKVVEMMNDIFSSRLNFHYSYAKVPHPEYIKRLFSCDIYIEMFAPEQMGNPYGCYGVTAFEAAALGRIVITQNIYPNIYKDAYGIEHPFIICNTEKEFKEKINDITNLPQMEIKKLKDKAREWAVNNHSYIATGNYLKKLFNL